MAWPEERFLAMPNTNWRFHTRESVLAYCTGPDANHVPYELVPLGVMDVIRREMAELVELAGCMELDRGLLLSIIEALPAEVKP